ncbi:unnamed protein product [Oikopleura dioica]|uniref:Uncharacterized protein n=1 Tax=Oikopleura dioica TaxID=34765 RepID=E4XTQ4_OIKDI|nr:unnamed protein product [Oikopleura dioica]
MNVLCSSANNYSFVTKKFKNFHDDYQLIQKHHKESFKDCKPKSFDHDIISNG